MKALISKGIDLPFYRGEEKHETAANFVNVDGYYYAYLGNIQLDIIGTIDYLIFTANDKIVGWYKEPKILKDICQLPNGHLYQVKAKDSGVVLLPQEDRYYSLTCEGDVGVIDIDSRLLRYLKQTKRINYRQSDLMATSTIPMQELSATAALIEQKIVAQDLLTALKLCNQALKHFGQKIIFIYDKAWILYLLNQYLQASFLLQKIKDVPAFSEHASYMLGNVYFQMGYYDKSIESFKNVKEINKDETCYMLSQAYAMKKDLKHALYYATKAVELNPKQEAYMQLVEDLKKWQNA